MNIVDTLIRLRDDLKEWVTNNIIELKNDLRNHTDTAKTKLEEKISDLSLGVHEDGFVYIYCDGKPQGTGIALIGGEERPFINIVPTLLDTDLTNVFNGIGYKKNARIRSTGEVTDIDPAYRNTLTGLIPVKDGDVLHIRGVDTVLYLDARYCGYISLWDSTGGFLASQILIPRAAVSTDENGDFAMSINYGTLGITNYPTTSYIRIQLGEITDELIITKNQLISVS